MGDSVGLRLPRSAIAVYHAADLLPLALGGLLIATMGALLPAGWAAKARTATALRTEQEVRFRARASGPHHNKRQEPVG
ncbi:hypothetical protein RB628_38370 [Streptomyces sp. ADMS]|uniref:hypothetical protein n=1 Tax=Streptomyces sp. ADMS TaxID=3071415 RepID=UPI00296F9917|nr:hypothetical protein [Streptomyces sp. ADMS]MDW4911027.1 hypothetical protein [Streptomyces sp. ADMS]